MSSSGAVTLGDIAGNVAMLRSSARSATGTGDIGSAASSSSTAPTLACRTFAKCSPATALASIPRPSTSDAQPGSSIVPEPMI
jgi:hypothetical protein